MTASYRNHVAGEKYTSPTVTLTKPAGTVAGDVVFAAFLNNDGTRVLTTLPDGWALLAYATAAAPSAGFWLCKKVAGASEPASYDFTFNYGFNGQTIIEAVKDGSDVSVVGVAEYSASQPTSPFDVVASGVTVPDNDSLLIWFGGARTTNTGVDPVYTQPTGYALRVDQGADYSTRSLAIADKVQATAGASGSAGGSMAQAGAGDTLTIGVLVAVAPAGGGSSITAAGEGEWPVVTSVALSSVSEQVPAGNYSDVLATVRDQSGTGLQYLTGTATSSDTNVATVSQLAATDGNGEATLRITGVAPGSATVTLTVDGVVSNSVAITVESASPSAVFIVPASVDLDAGATQTFTAALAGVDGADFVWSVESGGGSITSAGVYTAPSTATTAVVRAALSTDGNIYAEATVTVTVQAAEAGVVRTTWKRNRSGRSEPLAGYELDYWIISSTDTLITSGTETTDSSGTLTLRVSSAYSGQDVLVVVNNLDSDMVTVGKINGQQVATVG